MEIPLSQEYINIPEEDRSCFIEVIDRARPGQVSSSIQDLTVYDLQLRKVITPSYELRLGCSLTLWKAIESRIHLYIACLNWNSY